MEIELIGFGDSTKKLLPVAQLTLKIVRTLMPGPPPLGRRPIKCFYKPNDTLLMVVTDDG